MNPLNLLKKKEKPPVCSVVIVAAGSSQRMGGDKLTMKLGAGPVLGRTILAFENSPLVDEIILVTRADRLEEIADLCRHAQGAPGGQRRRHADGIRSGRGFRRAPWG